MNEALRKAMAAVDLGELDVAAGLAVDPKTGGRWVDGRVPHPRPREAMAQLVGSDVEELCPGASAQPRDRARFGDEVRTVYPRRRDVPRDAWLGLFGQARSEIGILVYSGLFLAEDAGIVRLLAGRARSGVSVRLLLGYPQSAEIVRRGISEGVGESMAGRVHTALELLRPLVETPNVELQLHRTVLYNSIFRADDHAYVNPHIYGLAASDAPVLHVQRHELGTLFGTYVDSFDDIWAAAGGG
jgi:hypothetical protein